MSVFIKEDKKWSEKLLSYSSSVPVDGARGAGSFLRFFVNRFLAVSLTALWLFC